MRIGILSDTHSRYDAVRSALSWLRKRRIHLVLHCGDIEDAETVRLFEGFETHFVLGNCDWDKTGLQRAIEEIRGTLHDHFGHLELKGRKISWIHGDNQPLFRDIDNSGAYDFLFYGHSHIAEQHRSGPTLVVNPGALHRAKRKSFAILGLKRGEIETVLVDP